MYTRNILNRWNKRWGTIVLGGHFIPRKTLEALVQALNTKTIILKWQRTKLLLLIKTDFVSLNQQISTFVTHNIEHWEEMMPAQDPLLHWSWETASNYRNIMSEWKKEKTCVQWKRVFGFLTRASVTVNLMSFVNAPFLRKTLKRVKIWRQTVCLCLLVNERNGLSLQQDAHKTPPIEICLVRQYVLNCVCVWVIQ